MVPCKAAKIVLKKEYKLYVEYRVIPSKSNGAMLNHKKYVSMPWDPALFLDTPRIGLGQMDRLDGSEYRYNKY
jgi:hypothetical protein